MHIRCSWTVLIRQAMIHLQLIWEHLSPEHGLEQLRSTNKNLSKSGPSRSHTVQPLKMSLRLSIPTHMTLEIGHSDPRKEESLAPACTRKYSKWKATSLTLELYCQVCIPKAFHA